MLLFAADNHYKMHPGRVLHDAIKAHYDIDFYEDDCSCFDEPELAATYDLIILNMICGCCDLPMPPPAAGDHLHAYLKTGKPLLLLHSASAAFWQCDWWRPLVGLRWVRGTDADGFENSSHPHCAYTARVAKSRHPLCRQLQDVDMPMDELYTKLEQTAPISTLMEADAEGATHPMCYETITPWGGRILGYLPGHKPDVVALPGNIANCRVLIDSLLG